MLTYSLTPDYKAIDQMPAQIRAAHRLLLRDLAAQGERAYREALSDKKSLRDAAKGRVVGNRAQVEFDPQPALGATTGTSHSKRGRIKAVAIRGRKSFNVAEVVDKGRGPVRPKDAKAILIQVDRIPAGEGYIIARGKIFIVRRSAKGAKALNFSDKANRQFENAIPIIVHGAFVEAGL